MASILNVNKIRATGSTTDGLTIDSSGRVNQPALPAASFSYQGSNLSGAAVIPLNTQRVLQGGMSMSSNEITVPVSGLYKVGYYHLGTASSAYSVVFVRKNGSADVPPGNRNQFIPSQANSAFSYANIWSLSANDTIDFYVSSGAVHGNSSYNAMYVYLLG